MEFKSLMHISFLCEHFEEMMDFYGNTLKLKKKVEVKYGEYLDRDDRPAMQEIAKTDPDRVYYVYYEFAPGQFIELFPKAEGKKAAYLWSESLGYNHFALLVEDIHKAYDEFKKAGVPLVTGVSKGPSNTWQFWAHDPDGNHFEVMQFTEDSYQMKGHVL